ncbi:MAG: molybdopterin-guanine dinucleotide biosynthesis protein B [Defluviitaleaceae bacterium]|nr:molybdopterin-guanine dinucleotide biosynthesis protein B [Defluviitaleaceae bacterium]
MKLSTAILAGGKSRRVGGRNKSFLVYDNQSFIERISGQLAGFDEVLVSVGSKQEYEHLPYVLLEDEVRDVGPLGGIYTCLKFCRNEYLFVCATDMPNLTAELVEFMAEFISADYDCFVLKSESSIQPLCAIYSKSLVPLIDSLFRAKKYSPLAVFDSSRVKYIPLKYSRFGESVIANINHLADLDKLPRFRQPRVFAVSGVKNSGKTTLITRLLEVFKSDGYRVGVIKHDGHGFEIDTEHKDTYRSREAGSDVTLIYSQDRFALVKNQSDVCIRRFIDYFDDCDIVIIEGLKHSSFPKIEVVVDAPVCNEDTLLAIATDGGFMHKSVPTLRRNDISQLADIIKTQILQKSLNN